MRQEIISLRAQLREVCDCLQGCHNTDPARCERINAACMEIALLAASLSVLLDDFPEFTRPVKKPTQTFKDPRRPPGMY